MHSFLGYFWTCCYCPLGWVSFLFHGAKHLSMPARKIQNLISVALFPWIFFDLLLLPLGWVPFLFHGAKHPLMQPTQARNNFQNLIFVALFPSLFLDLLLLPLGLGTFFISWCKALLNAKLEKFKILSLLQYFLGYFWTCCCGLLGWVPFFISWFKAPHNTSNSS